MQVYSGVGDQQISLVGRRLKTTAPFLGLRLELQIGEELFARILVSTGGGAHNEKIVYLVDCSVAFEVAQKKLYNWDRVEYYALSVALASNFTRSED